MITEANRIVPQYEWEPHNMQYRRLGSSGLRVSVFSIGGWLTIGKSVSGDPAKELIKEALDHGINFIDTAESYDSGESERQIGRILKELNVRRTDIVLSTKIFFGVKRKGPNDNGLSRKHIIEGTLESLQRLEQDYVDIVFAHRPDSTVPMLETVRAFDWLINQGKAFYWGTSEWSARQLEEAFLIAQQYNLNAPIAEQVQYNAFKRERFEVEYAPLYKKYGLGTTIWSPLASGLLTGKYNTGIPEGSRFDKNKVFFKDTVGRLQSAEGKAQLATVQRLSEFAKSELNTDVTSLALAWTAFNPNSSTVILGASKASQVTENLKALEVLEKFTPEIYGKINDILGNEPKPATGPFGR